MPEPATPIACTLSLARMSERLDEFHALFAGHLLALRRQPRRLTLTLSAPDGPAGVEAATRDLVARERQCCSFLSFTVNRSGAELLVDVEAPANAEPTLDAMQELAGRAAPHATRARR